jgi:hypothetical protein
MTPRWLRIVFGPFFLFLLAQAGFSQTTITVDDAFFKDLRMAKFYGKVAEEKFYLAS